MTSAVTLDLERRYDAMLVDAVDMPIADGSAAGLTNETEVRKNNFDIIQPITLNAAITLRSITMRTRAAYTDSGAPGSILPTTMIVGIVPYVGRFQAYDPIAEATYALNIYNTYDSDGSERVLVMETHVITFDAPVYLDAGQYLMWVHR